MKIFYICIDEFIKKNSKDFLNRYADKALKTEKRFYEYTIGRCLIKTVARQYYDIENTEIVVNDKGKPLFKHSDLCFSLSHSKNIVIACFDKNNCGIDIEYLKNRDLKRFSEHYKTQFDTPEQFYRFWSLKEALYKLSDTSEKDYCARLCDEYILTVVSDNKSADTFDLYKIIKLNENGDGFVVKEDRLSYL